MNFYPKKDILIKIKTIFDKYDQEEREIYTNNGEGNCIMKETYFGDELFEKTVRIFDNNALIEEIIYSEGIIESKEKYFYDHNVLIKKEIYEGENNLFKTTDILYDRNQNEIKSIHYNQKGEVLVIWENEFNSISNKTLANQLDRNNNLIKEIKYLYSYDLQGNWLKKYEVEGIKASLITLREITYY